MKFFRVRSAPHLSLFATALLAGASARAAENKYDVLAKTLAPFINVLAEKTKNPNHAMSLTAQLERLTGLPPDLAAPRAELDVQFPDRLRLRAPILGAEVTLVRRGQELWATPGDRLRAALEAATWEKTLPKLDPKYRIEPFRLPLPQKQLVFLPALFAVEDGGSEVVDGLKCRLLHLTLLPELDRQLEEHGWSAKVWVTPEYKPARLIVARPGWEIAVRFQKVEFVPKVPDATWEPPAGADVLKLDPPRFQQLLRTLTN